jgi:hypothetical protein
MEMRIQTNRNGISCGVRLPLLNHWLLHHRCYIDWSANHVIQKKQEEIDSSNCRKSMRNQIYVHTACVTVGNALKY